MLPYGITIGTFYNLEEMKPHLYPDKSKGYLSQTKGPPKPKILNYSLIFSCNLKHR